jgi:hypothetical protein
MPRGPDFLIIGAQRAGTTWVYRLLRRHPALWLPSVKELHYFDQLGILRTWDKKKRRLAVLKSARSGFGPWYLNFLLERFLIRMHHILQRRSSFCIRLV